ncbi:aldehyde dehydrogenase family protein, partial [Streptomyces sp. BE20]|uniref:aldehyde dehydrogenase family protein n=1 Tax=Streptomyces sp. BE20 TaxID=3002525 RepID=UPI002E793B3C
MSNPHPEHLLNHIAGRWTPSLTGKVRPNLNPADTTDVIGDFTESGTEDATTAIDAATTAQHDWDTIGPIERAKLLKTAATLITERSETFAEAITREQGKRLSEGRGEVARSLTILDFTIGEARRINGVTTPAEEPRTLA